MTDPRVQKLAQVLVNYSLSLKAGEEFSLSTTPLAEELSLAVYEEAIKAGANVLVQNQLPGFEEIFFKLGSDAQIQYISPVQSLVIEKFNAMLIIEAECNTRELSNVDPSRLALRRRARAGVFKRMLERMGSGELKWCATVFPTHAGAQEADMSLREYQDFVYSAGMLDLPDPVAAWREEDARQQRLIAWLKGKDRVDIQGKDVDLRLALGGRAFLGASGKINFPDGEIFTSPVEDSANGWIRFRYPAIRYSREVSDIELWFEDGRVIKEKAGKNQEFLAKVLNTDPGARFSGEFGMARSTASSASPRISSSTRRSEAPSIWQSVLDTRRQEARMSPAFIGTCSVT